MNRRIAIVASLFALATFVTTAAPRAARADEAGYLYSYGVSDARYNDRIVSVDAFKPLGVPGLLRIYLDVLASQDSRTAGGVVPRVYADNYALGAVGVQYTRPWGLRAFVQAGESVGLGTVATVKSGPDVRTGVQFYREWAERPSRTQGYGNLYASETYLSRYADAITYAQIEVGRHPFTSRVDLFARGTLTLDTHAFYYSNLAELTLGLRYRPFGTHGPAFSIERVAGSYLRNLPGPDSGVLYGDFRPTVTYGQNL